MSLRERMGANDETATKHARLPTWRVVEHARLPRRNALFAVDQFDFANPAVDPQARGLRRPRRAHTDVDLSVPLRELARTDPVHLTQDNAARLQRLARSDHHAMRIGLEPHHIERLRRGNAKTTALTDGEVHNALMATEHAALQVDDLAGRDSVGLQAVDDVGVAAGGNEADVLAVVLVGDRQIEAMRQRARLALAHVAKRKAYAVELRLRGRKQEIALVTIGVLRAMQGARAIRQPARRDVVARRQHLRTELSRSREQFVKLDDAIALDARHRSFARDIALDKTLDHRLAEPFFVVEHIVRNADTVGHRTGIVNVLAGAAGALAVGGSAVIVELQRDPDDIVALSLQQGRGGRGIDAARHRDNDAGVLRSTFDVEAVSHGPVIGLVAAARARERRVFGASLRAFYL